MKRISITSSVNSGTRCALIKSGELVEVDYSDYHAEGSKVSEAHRRGVVISLNWDAGDMDADGLPCLLALAAAFVIARKNELCL